MIGLIAIAAATALPASASAAPCPVNPGSSTTWIAPGGGNFGEDGAWSNGTPSGSCDVVVTPAGSPTITMTSGASMKSLTLGGSGSTPTLVISAQSPNTNLDATTTGIDIAAGAAVILTCPTAPGECLGGPSGGSILNSGSSTIDNAGSITVDADSGTGARIDGNVNNTGSIQFNQSAAQLNGTLLNQGAIGVADGKVFKSRTSHCGDSTGTVLKNDTGGTITAVGTGTIDVFNYEQGNGTASGANPVQMPCGSLKYTGNGASKVRAYGGFSLSGEMQAAQSLVVSAEGPNTNAILGGNFTNKGAITLTCPVAPGECAGGAGGGAGINVAANTFTNAGTVTVAAASGTGAGLGSNTSGSIVNTGTMQFDQTAGLGGVIVNQGKIEIADEKTVRSETNCGDSGPNLKNDTGGQISAAGSGTLRVTNYEQGAGTTSGVEPVTVACGFLKYTGAGAGTVRATSGATLTGSIASGQVLRLIGPLNSAVPFGNAGTIVLEGGIVNTAALTNSGRLTGVGTVAGSLDNPSGTVAPGLLYPATLTVNGSYTQGSAGSLEVDVNGTGAGQFDKLAVGGSATLDGTLVLRPDGAYASSAAAGDSVAALTYGSTRSGQFAQTTTDPPLSCPKRFAASYDDGGKTVSAVVDNGAPCPVVIVDPPPPASVLPSPPLVPETTLGSHPRATVKTIKKSVKVSFSFSSDIAGATFKCKLDKGAYATCKPGKTYTVKPGKHKFSVVAVSAGGTDPSPATFDFKVVKKAKKKG